MKTTSKIFLFLALLLAFASCSTDNLQTVVPQNAEAIIKPPLFGFNANDPSKLFVIDKNDTTAITGDWQYCEGSGHVSGGIWTTRYYNGKGQYMQVQRALSPVFVENDFNSIGSSPGPFGSTIYWQTDWATSC